MPINITNLKLRTVSAVVFVLCMAAGLLYNAFSFVLLILIIHAGCTWEFLKLTNKIIFLKPKKLYNIGCIALSSAFIIWVSVSHGGMQDKIRVGLSSVFLISSAVVMGVYRVGARLEPGYHRFEKMILSIVYITLPCVLMVAIRTRSGWSAAASAVGNPSLLYPLVLIVCIWLNDTMAYLVGSWIGKTPFSKISPKKTWEGTIGGGVLCIVISAIAGYQYHSMVSFVVIATIAFVAGTLGDLLESKIKRMANVKDSGQLMPGHGGFLDRFDSLLVSIPFLWIYVMYFVE